MTLKKLMIGVFAALCGTTVWAMRTVSLVSLDDGQARLAFSGEGPTASLVFCYGAENGGVTPDGWEHVTTVGIVLSDQTEATIPLPEGWGDTVRQGKFFLYDGIAKLPNLAYVSDGLVACWDAWDNSATGAHDAKNRTTWVDTVGGRVFTYVKGTDGKVPIIDEKAIRFMGTSKATLDAESSSLLLDSGTNTVEAMIDDHGNGYSLTGTAASRIIWFVWDGRRFFSHCNVPANTGISQAGETSTWAAVYDQTEVGKAKSVPQIACYRNGVDEPRGSATYWNSGGNQIVLGYNAAGSSCAPVFRTLRFYNRALTEDELKLNAYVDRVRYFTDEATETVASSVRFTSDGTVLTSIAVTAEHGTVTGGGDYAPGTTVTLTATPSDEGCPFLYWKGLPPDVDASKATVSFTVQCDMGVTAVFRATYDPVTGEGRTAEVTAVSKDGQGVPVSATVAFGETSRTDTLYVAYGIADAGDDIGWWEHVEPLRAILPGETSCEVPLPRGWGETVQALRFFFRDGVNADSYVKEHLVAQWEGEDASADAWTDRIGGRTFVLSGATADGRSVSFGAEDASCGKLSANDSAATFEMASTRTVEACIDSLTDKLKNAIFFVIPKGPIIGTYQGYGTFLTTAGNEKTFSNDTTSPAKRFSVVYDANNTLMGGKIEGVDGVRTGKSSSWSLYGKDTTTILSYLSSCSFYMLRLYDTALSDLARAVNCAVDGERLFGRASSGAWVSCSKPLSSREDVKGTFTVTAEVLRGTVSGTGTFEEGTEVTVSVVMDDGCEFLNWTGDVPSGVDPTSPTIAFVLRGNVALTAKVLTPWMTETDEEGAVTALYNHEWRFEASASGSALTLVKRQSGAAETLDISRVSADTGYTVARFGELLFSNCQNPKRIVHAGGELTSIGASAFANSGIETFEPEEIPSLTAIGTYAFSYSSLRGLRAPNITSVGSRAFDSATKLTNVVKDVIGFALGSHALQNTSSVKGALVIERTGSFGASTFWGTGISNFTVKAQVSRVESFAFGSLAATAEIHWESKAPTELGTLDYQTQKIKAEGVFGRSARPYTKLFARRDLDGWRKLAEFTPVDEIDDMYKTPNFGWTPKTIGWIDTVYSDHYRCWIVDDRRGLVLIVR